MRTERHILRRITALVTSLVFLFSLGSYQLITAEEAKVTEDTEIQVTDDTDAEDVYASEDVVTQVTVTEAEEEDELIQDEITGDEAFADEEVILPDRQTVCINLSVNGTSFIKPLNIVQSLFYQVNVKSFSGYSVTAEMPYGKDIDELLWEKKKYQSGEKIFFSIGDTRYALENVSMTGTQVQLEITEYYNLSKVSMKDFIVLPADLEKQNEKELAYGTVMNVYPSNGWVIDGKSDFELHGVILSYISTSGNKNSFVIENGKEKINIPVHKSRYELTCPADSGVSMRIREHSGSTFSDTWIDSDEISADFSVNESSDFKITGVNLVNSLTGDKYPMDITGDGKNVSAHISTELLKEEERDNTKYCFDFEKVDDQINVESDISTDDNEAYYKNILCDTSVENSELYIEIPPVLYEGGIAKYVIDACVYSDSNIEKIELESLLDSDQLLKPIKKKCLSADGLTKILYKEIIQENDDFEKYVTCRKVKKESSLFYTKFERYIDLIILPENNEKNFYLLIDQLYDDGNKREITSKVKESYRYAYESNGSMINTLIIKSALYLENGELHNQINSPLYFYFDDHAPKLTITNTSDNSLDNSQWSKLIYKFTVRTDDGEAFPEKEGVSDEVNEIYRNINGAGSEISKITIDGCSFIKSNDKWVPENNDVKLPYALKIQQTADNEFEISAFISVDTNVSGLDRTIDITVTDSCGNTSEKQSFELKIDTEKPKLGAMTIRNAVHYNDPVYGRTAAVGRKITTDKFYADMEVSDDFSGLAKIQLVYGDYNVTYTPEQLSKMKTTGYRKDGNKYSFSLPVSLDKSERSEMKIILTDAANNTAVYYYNDDEKPVSSEAAAAKVVVDRCPPDAMVNSVVVPAYESRDGHSWYRRIPDFRVLANDASEKVNSGIRYLVFRVNGTEKKTEDLFTEKTENFRVTAEHSTSDPDKADVYYTDGTDKVKITTLDLKKSDGLVRVEVTAFDAAGNSSEKAFTEVYIDPDPPVSDTHFTIENDNDSARSFGTFLNHGTRIKVNVSEPENHPSAGLKEAVLYYGDEKYTCSFDAEKSASAWFDIPFDTAKPNAVSGTLKIVLKDNTGNTFSSEELLSSADSELMMFENVPPEINDIATDSIVRYIDSDNGRWYSSDADLKFTLDDSEKYSIHSGLRTAQIDINGKNIISDDFRNKTSKTSSVSYDLSTSEAAEKDGRFDITVRTEDNAGNPAEYLRTLFIDRTAPDITGMSIEGVGSVPLSILNGVYMLPYGYFFRESRKVTVYAEDRNASSGMNEISLALYKYDGTRLSETIVNASEMKFENDVYSAEFTVPEGFRGYIVTKAADNTENVSDPYTPQGFITENQARHGETSSAVLTLPATKYSDRNGLPLYNGDVAAEINASDEFSGIGSVEWNMSDYGENTWKRITADKEGKISGDGTFLVTERDSNLVLGVTGSIISSSDRNAGQMRIKMTDNAGNTSEDMKTFSIDKTAPGITVSYDDAVSDSVSGIFRTPRTANITVRERNFDQDRIEIIADGSSGTVAYGDWVLVSGTAGTDSAVYRIPVTFRGDGDYILGVEGTDMCDNKSQGYVSERFTVDTSAPQLEVISSGPEKINGRYYSGIRTVTVRITEHNFDASRINISGTMNGSEGAFPKPDSFISEGDVHTAVIRFEENADYTLKIEGEDMAGNSMESYSDSFCVDKSAPEIKFDGVENKSANSGKVELKVFINDDNITEDRISLKITGARRGDITEGSGVLERTDEGLVYVFSEFAETEDNDDIYTVTVSADDMSENKADDTIVFSVNRFGSTYLFSDETMAIADKYINKPADIIIHEINADMIYTENSVVKIIKNSEPVILEKGRDYEVYSSGGDGSWYDYSYFISATNFKDDGAYQVIISSQDAAGNMNANSLESKTSVLKFGVDRTPPKCTPVNVERNGAYRTEELEVEFFCEDNILLEQLDVFIDDEKINDRMESEGGRCRFLIQSGNYPCDIRVVMSDIAGNDAETLIDNILVSTSLIRIIIHKPEVKNGLIIAVTGAVTGAAGTVAWRRRRRREAI